MQKLPCTVKNINFCLSQIRRRSEGVFFAMYCHFFAMYCASTWQTNAPGSCKAQRGRIWLPCTVGDQPGNRPTVHRPKCEGRRLPCTVRAGAPAAASGRSSPAQPDPADRGLAGSCAPPRTRPKARLLRAPPRVIRAALAAALTQISSFLWYYQYINIFMYYFSATYFSVTRSWKSNTLIF